MPNTKQRFDRLLRAMLTKKPLSDDKRKPREKPPAKMAKPKRKKPAK